MGEIEELINDLLSADDDGIGQAKGVLFAELTRLRSERDAAVAMLQEVEWSGKTAGLHACPVCRRLWGEGARHAPDCRIGNLLARVEGEGR